MRTTLSKGHPYWCLRDYLQGLYGSVASLEFSYYEYKPQSLLDNRQVFSVGIDEFLDSDFCEGLIAKCPEGRELAVHSVVKTQSGLSLHLPMIDMSTGSAAQLEKLKPFLGESFGKYVWYKSGRSYHGYGRYMISHQDWIALMGRLLLANQIGFPPTVDPRWVGHRLIAGYSALRWTKNTLFYIDTPKLISEGV